MSNADNATAIILLIDDDRSFCTLLCDYFKSHAIQIIAGHDGKSGLEAVRKGGFDLILLDMFLPDMYGVEVLRHIRQETTVPVIILSAHNEETDRIVTLEMGADDYVPKKFSMRELLARIKVALRRRNIFPNDHGEPEFMQLRGLRLDNKTKEADLNNVSLELTATEFRILWAMTSQPGRVFMRESLMGMMGEKDFNKFDRSVDVHISSLRQKLGEDSKNPQYIKTMRGIGYSVIK